MTASATSSPEPDFAAALGELDAATGRLLATADGLDDAALRAPSRCPGWTRAHVLAHLARNADGFVNLSRWAGSGEEVPMYAGGRQGRDADIEAGSACPAADLRDDLRDSAARLREAFEQHLGGDALDRRVRFGSGTEATGRQLPLLRVREIEIHHVDLDADYTPAHWSPGFAVRTLDEVAPWFRAEREPAVAALHGTGTGRVWRLGRGPELSGAESALLAWLVGRSDGDGLQVDGGDGDVPAAPAWL